MTGACRFPVLCFVHANVGKDRKRIIGSRHLDRQALAHDQTSYRKFDHLIAVSRQGQKLAENVG